MSVREGYAEAGRITRREARNFAWGIALLPRTKRRAITALYAFARRVDDIADDPSLPPDERRTRLEACDRSVAALPAGAGDLVLAALADAIVRFDVPRTALHDLVRGGLMDVEVSRYETWDDLREYCRCVAGAVGIACAAVYRPREPERAWAAAETLGVALQQINIMRDVAEDWRLGRVYLPRDELLRFGVREDDIAEGRGGERWRALMRHQDERAEALLAEGLGLLRLLDPRSALCVRAFAGIYRGLLVQMREREYDVFAARPALTAFGKVRAVAAL